MPQEASQVQISICTGGDDRRAETSNTVLDVKTIGVLSKYNMTFFSFNSRYRLMQSSVISICLGPSGTRTLPVELDRKIQVTEMRNFRRLLSSS